MDYVILAFSALAMLMLGVAGVIMRRTNDATEFPVSAVVLGGAAVLLVAFADGIWFAVHPR